MLVYKNPTAVFLRTWLNCFVHIRFGRKTGAKPRQSQLFYPLSAAPSAAPWEFLQTRQASVLSHLYFPPSLRTIEGESETNVLSRPFCNMAILPSLKCGSPVRFDLVKPCDKICEFTKTYKVERGNWRKEGKNTSNRTTVGTYEMKLCWHSTIFSSFFF